MDITELTNSNLIDLNLQEDNQIEVIEKLANLLKMDNRIVSKEVLVKDVLERESEFSTGFGHGIAIPHCKSENVKRASIAIAKLEKAIDWNSMDGLPVELVILLAVPDTEGNTTHLQLMSSLASKLMKPEFRDLLLQADSYEDMIALLG